LFERSPRVRALVLLTPGRSQVQALVLLTPRRSQVQALDQKVRPGLFLAYEERKPTQEQVQDTIALTACLDNFFFGLVSGERACLLHNGDPELPSNPVSADKAAGEMRVLPCVVSILVCTD